MTYLRAIDVSITGEGDMILDRVSAAFGPGELVGLIGPNGAGKTTFIRSLLGLRKASAGEIRLEDRALSDWPRAEVAKRLGYLAQGAPCHWPVTAERIVELGRLPHVDGWTGMASEDRRQTDWALDRTGTTHLRHRVVTTLSGGERTLVMIARCLAGAAPLLLADEPITGLDPRHQIEIMRTFLARVGTETGVIAVIHDLNLAARFCTRLVLMAKGRIVADGPPKAVLTNANLSAVYGIEAEIHELDGHPVIVPRDVRE